MSSKIFVGDLVVRKRRAALTFRHKPKITFGRVIHVHEWKTSNDTVTFVTPYSGETDIAEDRELIVIKRAYCP